MAPRPPLTHFLCIPLVTPASRPQLTASLATFGADVTSPSGLALPAAAVRPVGTLHLTLGVMSFPGDEGLDRALALLRSLKPRDLWASARSTGPAAGAGGAGKAPDTGRPAAGPPAEELRITLRGLRAMQPASRASVLYAPPEDRLGALQRFCEALRAAFQEAGLMVREERPLLLHATVLNTVYARGGARGGRGGGRGGGGGGRGGKLTVDVQPVLDRYEDEVWAEGLRVEKIAICKMGAQKTQVDGVEDEVYQVVGSVNF